MLGVERMPSCSEWSTFLLEQHLQFVHSQSGKVSVMQQSMAPSLQVLSSCKQVGGYYNWVPIAIRFACTASKYWAWLSVSNCSQWRTSVRTHQRFQARSLFFVSRCFSHVSTSISKPATNFHPRTTLTTSDSSLLVASWKLSHVVPWSLNPKSCSVALLHEARFEQPSSCTFQGLSPQL